MAIPIKDRSTAFKVTAGLVPAVVAILGGIWAIDNHYASAADVEKMQQSVQTQVTSVQRSLETQVRSLRQEQVDDEIFKLQIKKESQGGKLSPLEAAMLERYIRKSTEITREQTLSDRVPTVSVPEAK